MAWIGPPGRLIEFKCPSSVVSTPMDQRKIFTSLGGRVSVTEPGPSAPTHTWQVTVSTATPQAVALLRGLSLREWGVGPFYWVPPAAEVTNLLSPSASLCIAFNFPQPTGVTQGGAMPVEDHFAGQSWKAGAGGYVVLGDAPVIPGKPVTLRAWCAGPGANLRAVFRNAAGEDIATRTGPTMAGVTGWAHATFTDVPVNAASVSIRAHGVTQATRPSVTWTPGPRAWDVGAASMSVSVQPVPSTYVRATGAVGRERITDHAFEITQVAS